MRNLKKALSLVLAMVMLLGMMVVGAGAASFKDNAQISDEYKTAAAVLEKIGVMEGTDGYFNPKAGLTRVEGAALIYRMVTSGLVKNPAGNSGFTDVDTVPSFSWASGTVAACRDLGIISGVTNTSFNPGEPLTTAAFAKMLLVALGYESDKQGYTGDSWVANVSRDARLRGITINTIGMNDTLTREQAAQMAFQTLTASMMEYTGLSGSIGDATFNSPATVRLHSQDQAGRITTYEGGTVTPTTPIRYCEQLFPDLKLSRTNVDDSFGRIYSVWTWKNVDIEGTDANIEADAVFTTKVKESEVKSTLGRVSGESDTQVNINGQQTQEDLRNNLTKRIAELSGNGRLVEVYSPASDKSSVYKIVVVDTALGEVTKVDSKKEEISIQLTASDVCSGKKLTTDVGYGEFNTGDKVLVQGYQDKDAASNLITGDITVSKVFAPEVVTGKATTNTRTGTITVDGTVYTVNTKANINAYNFGLTDKADATLYLDEYGFIIGGKAGVVPTTGAKDNVILVTDHVYKLDSKNHMVPYIVGINSKGETVELPAQSTEANSNEGKVCTVAKDTDNLYKSTEITSGNKNAVDFDATLYWFANTDSSDNIASSDTKVTGIGAAPNANKTCYYADDVKFIYVGAGTQAGKVSILTGVRGVVVGSTEAASLVHVINPNSGKNGGEISAVFVILEDDTKPPVNGTTQDIIYVSGLKDTGKTVVNGNQYHNYVAYINGEAQEIFYGTGNEAGTSYASRGLYYAKKNDDGAYILGGYELDNDMDIVGVANMNVGRSIMTLVDGTDIRITSDTQIIDTVRSSNRIESMADIQTEMREGNGVIVSVVTDTNGYADYVYITDVASAAGALTVTGGKVEPEAGTAFTAADAVTSINNVSVSDWPATSANGMGFYFEADRRDNYAGVTATLKITDADNNNVFTQTINVTGDNAAVSNAAKFAGAFWIDYVDGAANSADATGSLKTAGGLAVGTYDWSITVAGEVVASDSFVITVSTLLP